MQPGKKMTGFILTALLIGGMCVSGLHAQSPQQTGQNPKKANIDPFVDRIVLAVSDFLFGVDRLRVRGEIAYEVMLPSGQSIQLFRTFDARLNRPDHLRLELWDDRGHRRIFYDGNHLNIHLLDQNVFGAIAVTGSIDEMTTRIRENTGFDIPFADLLSNDLYARYTKSGVSGTYIGLHYLKGKQYHHLLMSNDDVDYQMWVPDVAEPLPAKVVVTYKRKPGAPRFSAEFIEWDLSPYQPDLMFEFNPPVDAEEIEILSLPKH